MKISAAFPSKYLKAADLPEDRTVTAIVDRIDIEDVAGNHDPDDERPVVYFKDKSRALVLNRTNANTLSAVYGDEADKWFGKPVILYRTETSFQGRMVPCIRVRVPKPQKITTEPSSEPEPESDDCDVPF